MRLMKVSIILLSCILLLALLPITVFSNENNEGKQVETNVKLGTYATKDEVIYANLSPNGDVQNVYVVNSFQVTEQGTIIDYGTYTDLRNLTNLSEIETNGTDEIHFYTEEDEFYYQGELENHPLPWDFSIKYYLNGSETEPKDLAGAQGEFEIHIETTANDSVNELFFEHYLLQISMSLDPAIFDDIQAPKGTIANEGRHKLVSFSVMPGQEGVFILSARVNDLQMDPINIAAIPANIAIEDPDLSSMTEDMKTLSDAIRDIHTGVSELKEGISELNDGVSELRDGSKKFNDGIGELDQSSGELVDGSEQILKALQEISVAMTMEESSEIPDFTSLALLPEGFREMGSNLRLLAEQLKELDEGLQMIPDGTLEQADIEQLYAHLYVSGADPSLTATVEELVTNYMVAQGIKSELDGTVGFSVLATLIEEMANHLQLIADGIEHELSQFDPTDQLEQLEELKNGLTNLASEYELFHNGLKEYTGGIGLLANSYGDLDAGIGELSQGTAALNDGTGQLKDGTQQLHEATSELPDELQTEFEKFMEEYDFSDFEPESFVSNKNENIGVVQFVMKTESIELEEEEPVVEEKVEEKKSFWDRLLELFR